MLLINLTILCNLELIILIIVTVEQFFLYLVIYFLMTIIFFRGLSLSLFINFSKNI